MKWTLVLTVAVAIVGFLLVRRQKNNVCKTFDDYYTNRDANKNCYYNPDHELEVPDLVRRHGYPIEVHKAVTEDGYILTVFRIPHGKENKTKPGKPIFIQHGFTLNAGTFLTTGKKSMGFILADAGYDVWLGNFRGTRYSRNHTTIDTTDSKYWNFSFHEHGIYDVSAQLELVNQITKKKVACIGFSMGGAAGYVYTSTFPDLARERIEIYIGLAPGVFLANRELSRFYIHIWRILEYPIQLLSNGEIYPRPLLPKTLFKYLCFPYPIQMKICQIYDMMILGFSYEQNDPETLPVTLLYNADASSVKAAAHIAQAMNSGKFQQFDYGAEENQKLYRAAEPPHYNLSNIVVPNYLIYAPNDQGITKENVEQLYRALPKKARKHGIYGIKNENFNHLDIFSGKDVVPLLYDPLISFLDSNFR